MEDMSLDELQPPVDDSAYPAAMGGKEEGEPVAVPRQPGFFVTKKVGYTLVAIAIAICVVVALIVYYAGVAGLECRVGDGGDEGGSSAAGAHKKRVGTISQSFRVM